MNDEYKGACDLITWVILKDLTDEATRFKQLEFIDALDMLGEDYQEFFEDLIANYFNSDSIFYEYIQIQIGNITRGHAVTDFDDLYQRSDALEKELEEWREASPNHLSANKQEK